MPLDYEKEGKIAIFTINRPRAFNAIDVETWQGLNSAMADFRDDPELWVGIVTGTGDKAFCSGADIKDTLPYMKEHSEWLWPAAPKYGLDSYKPLIAAINGAALGGGLEIALACDIRIASENARLGTPEVTLGIMPGWGATQRLSRVIPWAKAAEILFTGKPADAQEAYRIGLVNKVVSQLANPANGAVVTFVGMVRGETDGREVRYLEYEAYSEMAEGTLRQIGDEDTRIVNIKGVMTIRLLAMRGSLTYT